MLIKDIDDGPTKLLSYLFFDPQTQGLVDLLVVGNLIWGFNSIMDLS